MFETDTVIANLSTSFNDATLDESMEIDTPQVNGKLYKI